MKIFLINPPAKDLNINRDMAGGLGFSAGKDIILPPLDLLNMATILQQKGHDIFFVDCLAERILEVHEYIKQINPEVIIGLLSLPTMKYDINFYQKIKKDFDLRIFIKTGINYLPILEELLNLDIFSGVIFSDSDFLIEDIILDKTLSSCAVKRNGKFVIGETKYLEDLDSLPIPNRYFLKNELYQYRLLTGRFTTMQTSRGCPFTCGYYCPYPMVQGKEWRARSPRHVVSEIENIVFKHKIESIFFRDATFTLDKKRAHSICDLVLEKGIKFNWWCETRINCIDDDLIKKMKDAGCKGINIGVETGDEDLLKHEGKAGLSIQQIIKLRNLAKSIDLKLHFLMIAGLPSETKFSLFNTFKFIKKIEPDSMGITFITPYPGTPLFDEALKDSLIKKSNYQNYSAAIPVLKPRNLSILDLRIGRLLIQGCSFFIKKKYLIKKVGLYLLEILFRFWLVFKHHKVKA